MEITAAQRDVRTTFVGGFVGQLVSGAVWLLSAAAGTWVSERAAILMLGFGGMLIFPLTQLMLRAMGRTASLPKGHPMNGLAMQAAFVLPFTFPLIYAAAVHHLYWFYPAFMIALGAHYLPFIFLYGMAEFGVLSGVLTVAGVLIGLYAHEPFTLGGWFTGVVLLVFAFVGRRVAVAEGRGRTVERV
jgi:hypothetical protein